MDADLYQPTYVSTEKKTASCLVHYAVTPSPVNCSGSVPNSMHMVPNALTPVKPSNLFAKSPNAVSSCKQQMGSCHRAVKIEQITPCTTSQVCVSDDVSGINCLLSLDAKHSASAIATANSMKTAETTMHSELPVSDTIRLARANEKNVIRMIDIEASTANNVVTISSSPVHVNYGVRSCRVDATCEAVVALDPVIKTWLFNKFKVMPTGLVSLWFC